MAIAEYLRAPPGHLASTIPTYKESAMLGRQNFARMLPMLCSLSSPAAFHPPPPSPSSSSSTTFPSSPYPPLSFPPSKSSSPLHRVEEPHTCRSMASSISHSLKGMQRVGVVGAGIAGSSLARVLNEAGASVSVFEMGRGAGGRMATRKSRDYPGLAIHHGAPLFVVDDPEFAGMLEPYIAKGVVKPSASQVYSLDWRTKGMEQVKMDKTFVAHPDMTSLCESLLEGVQVRYQVPMRVRQVGL
eukprot:763482-Hanusia_phi.AAC.13